MPDPRQEDMVALRHDGYTLQEIGDAYGMTRERVRQLTAGLVDRERIKAARRGYSRLAADEAREAIMVQWREGSVPEAVARDQGLAITEVKRVIGEEASELEWHLRRTGSWDGRGVDQRARDLLEWLRRWAAAHGGRTPGINAFRKWKKDEPERPEPSGYMRYFGSWAAACEAAGLEPNKSNRHTYTRRWTDEECLEHVRQFGALIGKVPTYAAFEQYAREHDEVPSAVLIRMRIGSWSEILRIVYGQASAAGFTRDASRADEVVDQGKGGPDA